MAKDMMQTPWTCDADAVRRVLDVLWSVNSTPAATETRCVERTQYRPLIGLTGYARSGKDAAGGFLVRDAGYTRVALADGVREALLALNPSIAIRREHGGGVTPLAKYIEDCGGWDAAKKATEVRELLQRMGTEAGRDIHGKDCWIKLAKAKIEAASGPVVVTDVRFENEAQMIESLGGVVLCVMRPGVGRVNDHPSEGGVLATHTLANDGPLDRLRKNILAFAAV